MILPILKLVLDLVQKINSPVKCLISHRVLLVFLNLICLSVVQLNELDDLPQCEMQCLKCDGHVISPWVEKVLYVIRCVLLKMKKCVDDGFNSVVAENCRLVTLLLKLCLQYPDKLQLIIGHPIVKQELPPEPLIIDLNLWL